jgi:hypothetical protein
MNKEQNVEGLNVSPAIRKTDVISRFSFEEREPEIDAYISLVWEDGSDCECVYNGLDKSILPLPTHWYYVK